MKTPSYISQDPQKTYLYHLIEHIRNDLGLHSASTVFRNCRAGYCRITDREGRKHYQVVIGHQWPAIAAEDGALEYVSIKRRLWQIPWGSMKGYEAIHHLAIHELAHAIQSEEGRLRYGSVHNDSFRRALLDLRGLYPYSEFDREWLRRRSGPQRGVEQMRLARPVIRAAGPPEQSATQKEPSDWVRQTMLEWGFEPTR